jgi:hypothetical protein
LGIFLLLDVHFIIESFELNVAFLELNSTVLLAALSLSESTLEILDVGLVLFKNLFILVVSFDGVVSGSVMATDLLIDFLADEEDDLVDLIDAIELVEFGLTNVHCLEEGAESELELEDKFFGLELERILI